jgi:methylmalonyl-CoA/ethylmalonyl-CoA epimerase
MPDLEFHHIGVAVADIDAAAPFYERVLGYRRTDGPYDDPLQKVRVAFFRRAGGPADPMIELIAPMTDDAPVNRYLKKEAGAYHLCYVVNAMEDRLAAMRAERCLVVSGPTPAVAYGGRRIAWVFTPTRQLIELVERGA